MPADIVLDDIVLDEADWTDRRTLHVDRVARLLGTYLDNRARGSVDPVTDFLFGYYSFKPAHLKRWNPGFGMALTGSSATAYAHLASYESVALPAGGTAYRVRTALLEKRKPAVEFVRKLMDATAARPAHLGCFGLHEWAMVYHDTDGERRHRGVPLRLSRGATDAVVDGANLKCTHFDAFRFFTPDAAGRNSEILTRETQLAREQPGCVHASMDLYKWSYKLSPLIGSDLVTDCFELALRARTIDMRASPYDLSNHGLEPIAVETPEGRAEYVRAQAALASEAAPLRHELSRRCQNLMNRSIVPPGITGG